MIYSPDFCCFLFCLSSVQAEVLVRLETFLGLVLLNNADKDKLSRSACYDAYETFFPGLRWELRNAAAKSLPHPF